MNDADVCIADEHEALLSFVYMCPVGVLQIDQLGTIAMMNPMASQLLMPLVRNGVVANLFDALERCAPELRYLVSTFAEPRGRVCANRRLFAGDRKGAPFVLSCTMFKVDGQCMMVMLDDVSEQAAQECKLKQADSWMTAVFASVNDFACFTLDSAGRIDSWNEACEKQTGFKSAEAVGRTLEVLRPTGDEVPESSRSELECLSAARREGWHLHEERCVTRDGRIFLCQILVTAQKEHGGEACGFSVVIRDVTECRMTSDELRRLLTTDHLTGATNRARFFEAISAEIARWKRDHRPFSVIMIDADRFKLINDTFGHPGGDLVLRTLVSRWQPMLRANDILARFGGEEFVIMLPDTEIAGAVQFAERIRKSIADLPMAIEGQQVSVTVSVGCATIGDDLFDQEELLKAADVALYRAKSLGRNRTCLHKHAEIAGCGTSSFEVDLCKG